MTEIERIYLIKHLADTGEWRSLEVEFNLGAPIEDLVNRYIPVEIFYQSA